MLLDATDCGTANTCEFVCSSVACFVSEVGDFAEARELKGEALVTAQRILNKACLRFYILSKLLHRITKCATITPCAVLDCPTIGSVTNSD